MFLFHSFEVLKELLLLIESVMFPTLKEFSVNALLSLKQTLGDDSFLKEMPDSFRVDSFVPRYENPERLSSFDGEALLERFVTTTEVTVEPLKKSIKSLNFNLSPPEMYAAI